MNVLFAAAIALTGTLKSPPTTALQSTTRIGKGKYELVLKRHTEGVKCRAFATDDKNAVAIVTYDKVKTNVIYVVTGTLHQNKLGVKDHSFEIICEPKSKKI